MTRELNYSNDLLEELEEFETMKTEFVHPRDMEYDMELRFREDLGLFLQVRP